MNQKLLMPATKQAKSVIVSLVLALLALLVVSASAFASVASEAPVSGNDAAISHLSGCIQSNHALDVFYLIDDSSSLIDGPRAGDGKGSDPNGLRATVIGESVKSLWSLKQSNQSLQLNVAVGTFGDHFQKRLDWQTLDAASTQRFSTVIKRDMPGWNQGTATKWSYLKSAAQELRSRRQSSSPRCQALVWLTDGAINQGNLSEEVNEGQNAATLKQLCGSVPGRPNTGSSARGALMSELRAAGVTVMGILLADPNAQLPGDRDKASVMKSLVVGTGASGKFSSYQCGVVPLPKSDAPGFFEAASDPNDLAYQFALINERLRSDSPRECKPFVVDQGVSTFTVITTDKNWSLTSPRKKKFRASNAAASGIAVEKIGGISRIFVRVPRDLTDFNGHWEIGTGPTAKCQAFFSSGLGIKLDRTNFFQGESGLVKGRIIRLDDGNSADLGVYGDYSLELRVNQNRRVAHSAINIPVRDGQFVLDDIQLSPNTKDVYLQMQLDVRTKGGIAMNPASLVREISVNQKSDYPTVEAALSPMSDLISSQPSVGSLQVHGPKHGDGTVCFLPPGIRDSDRNRSWDLAHDFVIESTQAPLVKGTDRADVMCINLGQNSSKKILVKFTNKIHAESSVSGEIPIEMAGTHAQGQFPREENIPFQFTSRYQGQEHVRVLQILLIMLGILLPLAVLYVLVRATSKFVFGSDLVRTEFDVFYEAGVLTLVSDSKSSQYAGASLGDKKSKYSGEPHLQCVETSVPLLAFRVVKFLARAKSGTGVFTVSSARPGVQGRRLSRQLNRGETALIAQDIGKLWFVTLGLDIAPPREDLSSVSTELPSLSLADFSSHSQTGDETASGEARFRGKLVIYSRIKGQNTEASAVAAFQVSSGQLSKQIDKAINTRTQDLVSKMKPMSPATTIKSTKTSKKTSNPSEAAVHQKDNLPSLGEF